MTSQSSLHHWRMLLAIVSLCDEVSLVSITLFLIAFASSVILASRKLYWHGDRRTDQEWMHNNPPVPLLATVFRYRYHSPIVSVTTLVERKRLKLLDESSGKLTASVNQSIQLQWIHTLIVWNKHQTCCSESQVNSLIQFLGGVIWFRFHIQQDFSVVQTLTSQQPSRMTCSNLLLWAFEPTTPSTLKGETKNLAAREPKRLSTLVVDSIVLFIQIGLTQVDEVTIQFLLQSVVERHYSLRSQQLLYRRQVRGCLGYLRILYTDETLRLSSAVWTVGCHSWQPLLRLHSPPPLKMSRFESFLQSLERHVTGISVVPTDGDRNIFSSLIRASTNLGVYSKALELWRNPVLTIDMYCAPSIGDGSAGLCRVQAFQSVHRGAKRWINDGRYILERMQYALVESNVEGLWRQSLVKMSSALIAHTRTLFGTMDTDYRYATPCILCWVDSLSIIATELVNWYCWSEGLACWEQAQDLLEPLFANCIRGVSDRLWYVGIVLTSRGGSVKRIGERCLRWSSKLNQGPSPTSLLKCLHFVVNDCVPCRNIASSSTSSTTQSKTDRALAQKGAEYALRELWRSLQMVCSAGERMVLVCNGLSIDGTEAERSKQLGRIRKLVYQAIDDNIWLQCGQVYAADAAHNVTAL